MTNQSTRVAGVVRVKAVRKLANTILETGPLHFLVVLKEL
jgi:hypothetical protein